MKIFAETKGLILREVLKLILMVSLN